MGSARRVIMSTTICLVGIGVGRLPPVAIAMVLLLASGSAQGGAERDGKGYALVMPRGHRAVKVLTRWYNSFNF